jgi:hypothetical protein
MWFKVDDGFYDHPKVLKLCAMKGWERSLALWTLAGSWSSKQESDGNVPLFVVARLGFASADADRLILVGLWESVKDGFLFHNWAKANPLKTTLEAKRAANKKRVVEWRDKRDGVRLVTAGVTPLQTELQTQGVFSPLGRVGSGSESSSPDPDRVEQSPAEEHALDRCIREINQARAVAGLKSVSRMQGHAVEQMLFAAIEICENVEASYGAYLTHGDGWDRSKGFPIAKWAKTPMHWLQAAQPTPPNTKRPHVTRVSE